MWMCLRDVNLREDERTNHIRRIRDKGSGAMNDGDIYHACEGTDLRARIISRTMLSIYPLKRPVSITRVYY